jgi:hypothetical protein
MNNEQQELLDEAYKNYSKEYEKDNSIGMCLLVKRLDGKSTYRKPNKEMFVDLCTYDKTFSEKWGLKIEERELSLEERIELWYQQNQNKTGKRGMWEIDYVESYEGHKKLNSFNIPKRAISLTYNDKTIESYENNS